MAKTTLFTVIKTALQKAHRLETGSEPLLRPSSLSRRDFIKDSAQAGLAAIPLMAASRSVFALAGDAKFKSTDSVVIFGAGIAGLTAAYRLSKAGIPCEIYEASDRVGGRMFTLDRFNKEGMFCELGGELIDSINANLIQLAKELGVELEDFRPGDAGVEKQLYYFQGRCFYPEDLIPLFQPLAKRMAQDIAAVFPDSNKFYVRYDYHNDAAVKFDHISVEEYLYSKKGEVERWVTDLINHAYVGEYGLETSEQSSINLLYLINPDTSDGFELFGTSDEAMRVKGGSSRLVQAVQNALSKAKNVNLHMGHQLVRIADNDGSFKLTFATAGQTSTVGARQVVCTIPFSVLRQVEGLDGLELSPVKLKAIREFGYGTNAKYMIGFESRPWRTSAGNVKASTGYTFTDLPSQNFWDTSRLQKGSSGILTNFSGGKFGQNLSNSKLPDILNQLNQIYPGIKNLHDGNHKLMRWTTHPYVRGSYTCPKVGQYTTIFGANGESELGGRMLFAGEHCSIAFQGFMEGAIETGNNAAKQAIAQRSRSSK